MMLLSHCTVHSRELLGGGWEPRGFPVVVLLARRDQILMRRLFLQLGDHLVDGRGTAVQMWPRSSSCHR